jgi:hypothetical protein
MEKGVDGGLRSLLTLLESGPTGSLALAHTQTVFAPFSTILPLGKMEGEGLGLRR